MGPIRSLNYKLADWQKGAKMPRKLNPLHLHNEKWVRSYVTECMARGEQPDLTRATGRTTANILRTLGKALGSPYVPVPHTYHHGEPKTYANGQHLTKLYRDVAHKLGLKHFYSASIVFGQDDLLYVSFGEPVCGFNAEWRELK